MLRTYYLIWLRPITQFYFLKTELSNESQPVAYNVFWLFCRGILVSTITRRNHSNKWNKNTAKKITIILIWFVWKEIPYFLCYVVSVINIFTSSFPFFDLWLILDLSSFQQNITQCLNLQLPGDIAVIMMRRFSTL